MGIPRVIASAPTGYLADATGWTLFFLLCALIALPGLLLIRRLHRNGRARGESA
jgi:PAT family beta-lactamase induction signal transducer AmpG